MTAIGYIRVSTNGQADGFGPDIQRAAIVEWCGTHDITSASVYSDEGVSGKILERPGLGGALQQLGEGDVLIVARLDRLARDLVTQELLLADIRRRGADLVSCADGEQTYLADTPDDPSRKMIRQVLGAVAEYEREMVKLRLSLGRRAKRAAGGYAGGEPPFGWHLAAAGGLEQDDREQRVLRVMRYHRTVGGHTLDEVASVLNNLYRHHPRRGQRWTKQSVHRVLRADSGRLAATA